MPKSIAISSYTREVRIPIGKTSDMGAIDLNEEVEITLKGKIKRMEAERPAGQEYKSQEFRPAEVCLEISSVTLGDKENLFTTLSRKMDDECVSEPY